MKIVFCGKQSDYLEFKKIEKCYTLNSAPPMQEGYFIFEENENITWKQDEKGYVYPYVFGKIKEFIWQESLDAYVPIHVLLNHCQIDEKWLYMTLKNKISSKDKVCVFAFSFFDDTKNVNDWNKQFKKGQGYFYPMYTNVFFKYGVKKENIEWVNYFTDSKVEIENKIRNSSILVFPGGAPDLFMKRVKEFKLKQVLKRYRGLIIGASAGAMVQLDQYHITPDDEYPNFGYYTGLGYLKGFDLEVHYRASRIQKECAQKVMDEKKIKVYGIYESGGILVEKNQIKVFGKVDELLNLL